MASSVLASLATSRATTKLNASTMHNTTTTTRTRRARLPTTMITIYTTILCIMMLVAAASASPSSAAGNEELVGSMEIFPRQGAKPGQVLLANLQPFSGKLGGFSAPQISQSKDSSRPFEVDGNTFTDFASAADRACDNQKNECADAANAGRNNAFSVGECDKQNEQCKKAATAAKDTNFATFSFADDENEYFCEE
ncbi:uncharacterized protein B0I36DRAFT_314352 [Microdochium trichocladiopsis]|uniref:Uncharacterized protein n=1 Tax=Microdochium trichocladiopsis TaxID=1682393 RepID=A0A9P9BUK5_9PEZI|nr:uncharacterized protein B0I36DRAFT_314352 [Microdochium trichocladiopsis]KAH7037574.1 hypothetical protein B0I36DRAFT_314352 [Microdochium trichocladiopsis]